MTRGRKFFLATLLVFHRRRRSLWEASSDFVKETYALVQLASYLISILLRVRTLSSLQIHIPLQQLGNGLLQLSYDSVPKRAPLQPSSNTLH
jgi:hypothetical protein